MFKFTHACGHSLTTLGKESPDGHKEWSYTNEIVKYIMDELDTYENVQQRRIDDPTGKIDYPLVTRTNMVNTFNPILHIDYHLNAFGSGWTSPGGTEVFVYKLTLKDAVSVANKVQNNLVNALGFANRGVKAGDLHMIRETNPTAILIEFAFMTNKDEAMKMRTKEYQKKAALAVVKAIAEQYGLKKKYVSPVLQKLKEETDMLEKAVVIFGEADYPTGKRLAARLGGAPVFARSDVAGKKVARELYVVGGDTNGMVADKVVLLSGDDYFATVAAVKRFLG